MKPGDLVEWRFIDTRAPVTSGHDMWSSVMQRYVPIGGINLIVSYKDGFFSFINAASASVLQACDADGGVLRPAGRRVAHAVPHVLRGLNT
jgi:hypothetical protein